MRRAMNRTVGDKTHESARYGSFLTVERPSRKGFDRLGLILIRQALEGRLPLFTELPRRLEAVEKPPRSSFWPLSRSVKSRFCSVLALDFRCFGAVSDYRPVQRRLFQQAGV